ncbi:MAG: cell division protein FtsL [Gammaproteobacteria bacterium]|jgi:cell division protein FtsL
MKRLFFLVLLAAVLVSAIEVVVARHQSRRLFVGLEDLKGVRDALNEEWGRLQLEQSTWATDARVESLAHTKLDLRVPSMNAVVLVPE